MAALQQSSNIANNNNTKTYPVDINVTASVSNESSDGSESLATLQQQSQHSPQECSNNGSTMNNNYLQSMQNIIQAQSDFSNQGVHDLQSHPLTSNAGDFFTTRAEGVFSGMDAAAAVKSEFGVQQERDGILSSDAVMENATHCMNPNDNRNNVARSGKKKVESPPTVYPWMKRIHVSHGKLQIDDGNDIYLERNKNPIL